MLALILYAVGLISAIRPASGCAAEWYTNAKSSFVFFRAKSSIYNVKVQTTGRVDILLTELPTVADSHYMISLGRITDKNRWAVLSKNEDTQMEVRMPSGLLSGSKLDEFTIYLNASGYIAVAVKMSAELSPLILWKDNNAILKTPKVQYIGVRTRKATSDSADYHIGGTPNFFNDDSLWKVEAVSQMDIFEYMMKSLISASNSTSNALDGYNNQSTLSNNQPVIINNEN